MSVRLANSGPRSWTMSIDDYGNREYSVTHRVEADTPGEGPSLIRLLSTLPQPGDVYNFNNGEVDNAATCTSRMNIRPVQGDGGETFYDVEQFFSTKPRCLLTNPDNPLLDPPKISGSFISFQEEAVLDRFGEPIKNSAHEQLRGPQVEFDANRPQITIEQNVLNLALPLLALMVDTVNADFLWGYPPRTVKLSRVDWEELYHGRCYTYYKRKLTFDIRYRCIDGVMEAYVGGYTPTGTGTNSGFGTGTMLMGTCGEYETFDKTILDEGTKVLKGRWGRGGGDGSGWVLENIDGAPPNPDNPSHFIRYKDRNNENTRVILNGRGIPWDPGGYTTGTGDDVLGKIRIEKYGQSNFLLLGIPEDIG